MLRVCHLFTNFARKKTDVIMNNIINTYKHHLGMAAIYAGVFLLIVAFICGWTTHNWLLFLCLALIIGGLALHVVMVKKKSKY
jgi:hypothetical protein